jgi:anti-sigma factor RsiW
MDCQNFKELLDSYLCGELAIETIHSILRHAERCGACRGEMAARRRLRVSLRSVCSKEKMSDRAMERLRERIRSEAGVGAGSAASSFIKGRGRNGWFAGLFKIWLLTPAAMALLLGAAFGLYIMRRDAANDARLARRLSSEQINALQLSASLVAESAGVHRICAAHLIGAGAGNPAEMPDSVREYDPACARLEQIAAEGARGLSLRAAHVCRFGDRKFAHLLYTHVGGPVSLFVTARDTRALKSGTTPPFSGLSLGQQRFTLDHIALGAYQTLKRIILVASDLPEDENASLAERLARPVVEHLRKSEAGAGLEEKTGSLRRTSFNLASSEAFDMSNCEALNR